MTKINNTIAREIINTYNDCKDLEKVKNTAFLDTDTGRFFKFKDIDSLKIHLDRSDSFFQKILDSLIIFARLVLKKDTFNLPDTKVLTKEGTTCIENKIIIKVFESGYEGGVSRESLSPLLMKYETQMFVALALGFIFCLTGGYLLFENKGSKELRCESQGF